MPKKLAFGDVMKLHFHSVFPNISYNPKPVEEYRIFAQSCRSVDSNVWIHHLENTYGNALQRYDDFIITDCRQTNEANWAIRNGFTLIRIFAEESNCINRAKSLGEDIVNIENSADSSISSIPYNYEIYNNGSIIELKEEVEKVYNKIKLKGDI